MSRFVPAILSLLCALPSPTPAAARDLVVLGVGGAVGAAQAAALFEPAQAAGIAITARVWQPSSLALETEMAGGRAIPDMLQLRGDLLRQACAAGRLIKLDWDKLGRDKFAPSAIQDCGIGSLLVATALVWNREKFSGTPGWAEFWDIARLPGKRGLPASPRATLEIALLADGVAPADIYKTLRTEEGIDRAFRKLDQLRPFIAWWKTGAEGARMLTSGEVLLAAVPTGDIAAPPVSPVAVAGPTAKPAAAVDLAVQWSGALTSVLFWSVRAHTDMPEQALKFLALTTDPALQARLQATTGYGGLAKSDTPPDDGPFSTAAPGRMAGALAMDDAFWRDNLQRLSDRFEAWLQI